MSRTRFTVATRRSALALAQARAFLQTVLQANADVTIEELHVVTSGDRIQDRPLSEVGGKGLFVKEIEEALLDRRADFAVHSMKDLPAHLPPGLFIACIPERADPRDVLLVRTGNEPSIAALPRGARVGSSSQRRRIALARHRPDLVIEPLRGNVDTRLRKLKEGAHDAIVLAAAGLARLGLAADALPPHAPLSPSEMLPAVAQGILAIEAREDDAEVIALLASLEHAPSRLRASAERGVLQALDADCTVPLAAFSTFEGDRLTIEAWLSEPDGSRMRTHRATAPITNARDAIAFGLDVGKTLKG